MSTQSSHETREGPDLPPELDRALQLTCFCAVFVTGGLVIGAFLEHTTRYGVLWFVAGLWVSSGFSVWRIARRYGRYVEQLRHEREQARQTERDRLDVRKEARPPRDLFGAVPDSMEQAWQRGWEHNGYFHFPVGKITEADLPYAPAGFPNRFVTSFDLLRGDHCLANLDDAALAEHEVRVSDWLQGVWDDPREEKLKDQLRRELGMVRAEMALRRDWQAIPPQQVSQQARPYTEKHGIS